MSDWNGSGEENRLVLQETIQPFICSSKKDGVEVRLARTFARFTAQNIWDEEVRTLTLRLGGKNDMKRRTFLRNAAAGGLAVAVAPSVTRSADQEVRRTGRGAACDLQPIARQNPSALSPRRSRPMASFSSRASRHAIREEAAR